MKSIGKLISFVLIFCFVIFVISFGYWILEYQSDSTKSVKCSSQLKGIGTAIYIYGEDNNNHLPMVGSPGAEYGGFGRGLYAELNLRWVTPNYSGLNKEATPGGCLYLLVKYADMTPGSFVCPGTKDKEISFKKAQEIGEKHGWELQNWTHLNDFRDCPYGS